MLCRKNSDDEKKDFITLAIGELGSRRRQNRRRGHSSRQLRQVHLRRGDGPTGSVLSSIYLSEFALCGLTSGQGVQYLTVENLKLVMAEFSTLS
jgi:hypothetical protein